MVHFGHELGKRAGDWFGPATLAILLLRALEAARKTHPVLATLRVYVARDSVIYHDDVECLCASDDGNSGAVSERVTTAPASQADSSVEEWKSRVLILIPVRLGTVGRPNDVYLECMKSFLKLPSCVGIIGGRPRHSLYFMGFQGKHLIYLDPHYCQKSIDTSSDDFPLQSYHCFSPRKMSFRRMDPSCTLGFYCRTRAEFQQVATLTTDIQREACHNSPIFSFAHGTFSDAE